MFDFLQIDRYKIIVRPFSRSLQYLRNLKRFLSLLLIIRTHHISAYIRVTQFSPARLVGQDDSNFFNLNFSLCSVTFFFHLVLLDFLLTPALLRISQVLLFLSVDGHLVNHQQRLHRNENQNLLKNKNNPREEHAGIWRLYSVPCDVYMVQGLSDSCIIRKNS